MRRSIWPRIFAFVLFELGFALALRADAAPLLAQMAPCAHQPRERILHARKIDLQPRLAGLRPFAENIEDDLLAVDDQHAGDLFPVALLAGGQFVVENDHVDLLFLHQRGDFVRLARAEQELGIILPVVDEHALHHGNAERVHQFFKFLQQTRCFQLFLGLDVSAHQQRALHHPGLVFDFKHMRTVSVSERRTSAMIAEVPGS